MKYQCYFSEKNIINLSSAEFAQRVVKVKVIHQGHFYFFLFLARWDYVLEELMLSSSHMRWRLSASTSGLAQCLSF